MSFGWRPKELHRGYKRPHLASSSVEPGSASVMEERRSGIQRKTMFLERWVSGILCLVCSSHDDDDDDDDDDEWMKNEKSSREKCNIIISPLDFRLYFHHR